MSITRKRHNSKQWNTYDIETKVRGIYRCTKSKLYYYTILIDNNIVKSKKYKTLEECSNVYNNILFSKAVLKNKRQSKKNVIYEVVHATRKRVDKNIRINLHHIHDLNSSRDRFNKCIPQKIHRRKIDDWTRNIIYTRQGNCCNLCKEQLGIDRIVDHIIPLFLNGVDNIHNYQSLCSICNKWKTFKFDHFLKNYMNTNKNIKLDNIKELLMDKYTKMFGDYD
jgi:5-methylcytosine-specific restriction endonuclease McrA